MNRDAKRQLIEWLEKIAKDLESDPDKIAIAADEYGERTKLGSISAMPHRVGGLETLCSSSAARIRGAVDVYLKGKR